MFIAMNSKLPFEDSDLLVRRRRSLGIDQRTLSQLSGVALHTLSNIESGKGNPTLATLRRILDVLGLEIVIQVKRGK